jgi:hypothetical protein
MSKEKDILDTASKFNSYLDWKEWLIESHKFNINQFIYFLKKNNLKIKQVKQLFSHRRCGRCNVNYIDKTKKNYRGYYCVSCLKIHYRNSYITQKKQNKPKPNSQYFKKRKIEVCNAFMKTPEFTALVNVVREHGHLKFDKEIKKIYKVDFPEISNHILDWIILIIRKKENIKRLGKFERLSTDEKREYYRKARKKYSHVTNPNLAKKLNRDSQIKHRQNPIHRLSGNLRTRINTVLKEKSFPKTKHLKDILGCDWIMLENWLSNQFVGNMNMDNYGIMWSLQHIVPLTHCENTDEVNLLNYYKNLKPMTLDENISLNDNLLWSDLNNWHFENEDVMRIIENIYNKDKILDYSNVLDKLLTDSKPSKKTWVNEHCWKTNALIKNIAVNNSMEVLKEVFTNDMLEKLKEKLELK